MNRLVASQSTLRLITCRCGCTYLCWPDHSFQHRHFQWLSRCRMVRLGMPHVAKDYAPVNYDEER